MSIKKVKFSQIPQPFTCTIITEKTPADCIRTIKLSDFDGTEAYQMHLMMLEKQYLNEDDLKKIYQSTIKPILVSHYRWDYTKHIDMDEDKRIRLLVKCFKGGASGIDLEADAFAPVPGPPEWTDEARKYTLDPNSKPREFTMSPEAVARQKEVIHEIHQLGGEVLMSAHTRVRLPVEQCVSMALALEERGADIVKVVRTDTCFEDLFDTFRATLAIKKVLKVPFIMGSHGQHSKIGRVVCPMLGSMLAWCTQPISPEGYPLQPPIKMQKAAWNNIDWHITQSPEEETWL